MTCWTVLFSGVFKETPFCLPLALALIVTVGSSIVGIPRAISFMVFRKTILSRLAKVNDFLKDQADKPTGYKSKNTIQTSNKNQGLQLVPLHAWRLVLKNLQTAL